MNKTVNLASRSTMRLVVLTAVCCVFGVYCVAVRAEAIPAFVSILPLKHFVERVGGNYVRVGVMVEPGQSPHTNEPSPRQMAALTEAKVYFRIGVSFEDVWMERIAAAHPALRIVDVRKGVALRMMETDLAAHHHSRPRKQGSDRRAMRSDPHIWTDPQRVKIIAKTIEEALSAMDPTHRAHYQANFTEFANELDRLDEAIRGHLVGKSGGRFMVFHPAWSYFAAAYGLQQIPIEMAGKEPGAKELAYLIDTAKALGIRVVLVQTQFSRRNAETIAQAIDGRVIAIDPLAENYSENLLFVAKTIAEAIP